MAGTSGRRTGQITFRHLANMTGGYARPEPPGTAWAYNDFAIQLYQKTPYFDQGLPGRSRQRSSPPGWTGPLRFRDGLEFTGRRRLRASVRDFARIAWFWANRGRWGDRQLLPRRYFDKYMRPDVPADLPHTAEAETDDYLGMGGSSAAVRTTSPGTVPESTDSTGGSTPRAGYLHPGGPDLARRHGGDDHDHRSRGQLLGADARPPPGARLRRRGIGVNCGPATPGRR